MYIYTAIREFPSWIQQEFCTGTMHAAKCCKIRYRVYVCSGSSGNMLHWPAALCSSQLFTLNAQVWPWRCKSWKHQLPLVGGLAQQTASVDHLSIGASSRPQRQHRGDGKDNSNLRSVNPPPHKHLRIQATLVHAPLYNPSSSQYRINTTMASAQQDVQLHDFSNIFSLKGKVAVVSGGSRGLGLHAASGYQTLAPVVSLL
jgi:hypothetical protein